MNFDPKFASHVQEFGAYSKEGTAYCLTQLPYLDHIAGHSNGYVVQGETYYTALGYDLTGNPFRLWWEITNPQADDASDACDWQVFEAQPITADPAPWHPESADYQL